MLPKDIAKLVPKTHLMSESEWRNLGVQQSQGWVHYMIHEPGEARGGCPGTTCPGPAAPLTLPSRPPLSCRAAHPPLPTAAAQEAGEVNGAAAGRATEAPSCSSPVPLAPRSPPTCPPGGPVPPPGGLALPGRGRAAGCP